MKNVITFLFLIQISLIGKSQNLPDSLLKYYKLSNEAKWNLYSNNNNAAINNYREAFKYYKAFPEHVFDVIEIYKALNKYDSALAYAEYSVKNFGVPIDKFFNDSIISVYNLNVKQKNWLAYFYNDYSKIKKIAMLEHYMHNDIFFRSLLPNFNMQDYSCIKNKSEFSFKMALQYDSIYAIPFVNRLISEYNFPEPYDVGSYAVKGFYVMLRHYNTEKFILDSALINGKIPPDEYASIVDYHFNWDWEEFLSENRKPEPAKPMKNFGPNLRMVNNKMVMGEIDDIVNVDKLRSKIGLMPIWQYARIKNFELSDEYKKILDKNKIKYN